MISSLYDASRSHYLPPVASLMGHATLIEQITDRTDLLVLDNDLTRILGAGDLTIVTPRSRPLRSFLLEIRTHGDIDSDPLATVTIQGVFAESGLDDGVREQLRSALDFQEGSGPPRGTRKHRQLQEIAEKTERLYGVLFGARVRLPAPARLHSGSVVQVLRRAELRGYGFDIPRDGVAYLAVSQSDGADVNVQPALGALARAGVDVNDDAWGSACTLSVESIPEFAWVLPPVALWWIPPDLRARILNQDLVLTGFVRRDIWERSFAARGWSFEVGEDHGWKIGKLQVARELDWSSAMHAQLGTAFLGFDPDDVVQAIVREDGTSSDTLRL